VDRLALPFSSSCFFHLLRQPSELVPVIWIVNCCENFANAQNLGRQIIIPGHDANHAASRSANSGINGAGALSQTFPRTSRISRVFAIMRSDTSKITEMHLPSG
jgi:hypothetical protein